MLKINFGKIENCGAIFATINCIIPVHFFACRLASLQATSDDGFFNSSNLNFNIFVTLFLLIQQTSNLYSLLLIIFSTLSMNSNHFDACHISVAKHITVPDNAVTI